MNQFGPLSPVPDKIQNGSVYTGSSGITIREYALIHIAAGMCANPGTNAFKFDEVAASARKLVDALMNVN